MKNLIMFALGLASAANAVAIVARPEWWFMGMLFSATMPFAGAIVAIFGTATPTAGRTE